MTNQQAPEIYALHTVPNEGETPWCGIYDMYADAERDAKAMRDATGRDWSVVRLVVADIAATPTGPMTEHDWRHSASYGGELCATCGAVKGTRRGRASCGTAQQPATHVQKPAESEHVAGDAPKNGPESNMAQQPAPSEPQPFGWIKQSEIDSSNDFGGSINLWRRKYDCDVPVYLAQQPAPSAAADLIAALEEARSAINSMKVEAETAAQGDEQMMLEACETISNEGLQADMAIRAALASAPQPSPTPQADSAQDEPLQAFDSPRAQALMRAWEEGWAACRDAEYVGEEAQNDAFNSSHTLTLCIAEDQQLPAPQADSQPAPIDMVLHCPACGLQHIDAPDERTPDWKNEPHRSHLCHGCGHIWRPADVPTNGVAAVKTTGKADSPIAPHAPADSVLDAARLWDAFIEAWRNEIGVGKIVNIMGGADKLKAVFLDAARKQGGKP